MQPLTKQDREELLKNSPSITVEELDEYELLLSHRYRSDPVSFSKMPRLKELSDKIMGVKNVKTD